jgi:hypothetical protein
MESLDGATSAECFCSTRCTPRAVLETFTKPYCGVKINATSVQSLLGLVHFFSKLLLSAPRSPVLLSSSSSFPSRFILDLVCVRRSAGNNMVVLLGWLDCFSGRTALCQQNHPSSTAFKNCRLGAPRIGPRCKLIDC